MRHWEKVLAVKEQGPAFRLLGIGKNICHTRLFISQAGAEHSENRAKEENRLFHRHCLTPP
ncbi:MAG TPA: hypothetical protein PK529_14750 [Verrucomicrobiales bacterium]|nr:hypothetical protein [Verrucomicrobiales bacterium]